MIVLRAIQVALWLGCLCAGAVLIAAYLFPSTRGPNWKESDLLLAAVFLLISIALKPEGLFR